jgi:hypothetical protein
MQNSLFFMIRLWPSAIGLLFAAFLYYFTRRRSWLIGAISLGAISTLAIVATYIWPPSDPDFAGGVFVWHCDVYYPLFCLSLICWLGALVFVVGYICQKEKRTKIKMVLPVIFLLPFAYEVFAIICSFFR